MLYLGIDQHARQLTVSLRNDAGDVLLARQVSTQPEKVHVFFDRLTKQRLESGEEFVVVLEVCGFNDWLIRLLRDYRCHKVILIQPEERKKRKTDRRDAASLSELLWANRERLLAGKPVRGLRQVDLTAATDQENRRLTTLRKEVSKSRTRTINRVKHILRRHNFQWQMPTKTFPTKAALAWLERLTLPTIAVVAADEPETAANRVEPTTFTCKSPPGSRPNHGASPENRDRPSPAATRTARIRMKSGRDSSGVGMTEPQITPLEKISIGIFGLKIESRT